MTALARIEGRPLGIVANNPVHLAGAITSDGADKAARFMQLCDAFGLPIVSLIDTPGMMVGPEAEATALVRHTSRLFVTGAALRVPLVAAAHEHAKARNAATLFELDDVIDPAELRRVIASTLAAATSSGQAPADRRFVDTW